MTTTMTCSPTASWLVGPRCALAVDRKKLAAFSALGGGFLRFPIGDRRCNRTRASVGNAGGNARPSLTNATLAASRLLARNLGLEVDKLEIRRAEDIVTAVEPLKSEEASPGTRVSNICSASYN